VSTPRPRHWLLATLLAFFIASSAEAQRSDTLVVLSPDHMSSWMSGRTPIPGVEGLALYGTTSAPGPYVVRTRFQDGAGIGPHYHDRTITITVISGVFHLGFGDIEDRALGRGYSPGSFIVIPPRMRHFEWGQGETIIQVGGLGPLVTTLLPADTTHR
jgi:hypothetical protein